MSVYANTNLHIATNDLRMSCHANQVEVAAEADELDVTTFCSGGWRQRITGLASFNVMASGFQDYVAPGPGVTFPSDTALSGALDTFTVAPTGDTAGSPAFFGQSRNVSLTELSGSVGEVAGFSLGAAGTSRLVRGVMAHPVLERTATGTGDILALTAPDVGQALYASFHVHSVTGTGSIVFTVQSASGVVFSGPNTRITSSSFTAVGHEFASAATYNNNWARVGWTITGFTAVTFSAAIGVGPA